MRGLKNKVVISIAVTMMGTLIAVTMLKSVMTAVHHAELLEALTTVTKPYPNTSVSSQ